MSDPTITNESARRGVAAVVEALGLKELPAGELEIIADAVVGLVEVLGAGALKRAAAAGQVAAAKITTAEEAEKAAMERK